MVNCYNCGLYYFSVEKKGDVWNANDFYSKLVEKQ